MQKFGRYIGIAVSVCCQSFGIPARRQKTLTANTIAGYLDKHDNIL